MPETLDSTSQTAVTRIVRQSRIMAVAYGSLGFIGIFALFFDRSLLAILGVLLPLQVAWTEWRLGLRVARIGTGSSVNPLLWHQLWILSAGLSILWMLANWPIEPLWEELPAELQAQLAEATAAFGLDPVTYLQFSLRLTVILTAILFVGKVAFIAYRYARLGRKLPRQSV